MISTNRERIARTAVVILLVGLSVGLSIYLGGFTGPPAERRDVDAYWNAALRLREGAPLYPFLSDSGSETTYRYAPWFAWIWVPLTFLPQRDVYLAWRLILLAATAVSVWPLIREKRAPAVLLALLILPFLMAAVGNGNVQPLIVASLVYSLGRPAGPIAIGLAASLKFFPIFYVVIFVARRQWRSAIATLGVASLLAAPIVLFDLEHYPTSPEITGSLWAITPILWATGFVAAVGAALKFGSSRAGWFVGSLLVFMASPRVTSYDITMLLATGPDLTGSARRAAK